MDGLPFHVGDEVEVIVREKSDQSEAPDNEGLIWLENFRNAIHVACDKEGNRDDLPTDLAATWKQQKRERLLGQNREP